MSIKMNEFDIEKSKDESHDQNLKRDLSDHQQETHTSRSFLIKYPKVGPFSAFSDTFLEEVTLFNDFVVSGLKFYSYLATYNLQYMSTYNDALIKFNKESSVITINSNNTFDSYKKLMIDTFEKEFTHLLNSKAFLDNYLNLSNEYSTLLKIYQTQFSKFLKIMNYPTKEDIDSMVEEFGYFRKQIFNLNQLMEKRIGHDANKTDSRKKDN